MGRCTDSVDPFDDRRGGVRDGMCVKRPSTSQAPPEHPRQPAATGAMADEQVTRAKAAEAVGQTGAGGGEAGAGEGTESLPRPRGRGGVTPAWSSATAGSQDGAAAEGAGQQPGDQPPAGSPATGSEATTLERQLDESLEEFDRRMREEMEACRRNLGRRARAPGAGAAPLRQVRVAAQAESRADPGTAPKAEARRVAIQPDRSEDLAPAGPGRIGCPPTSATDLMMTSSPASFERPPWPRKIPS